MKVDRKGFVRQNVAAVALLVILALSAVHGSPAGALGKEELKRGLHATVRIATPVSGEEDVFSTGSGSILTQAGHILTNFHVIGDTDTGLLKNPEGTAFVAVNPADLRGLPTWTFQAVFVRGDPDLDLAVLRITAPLNGVGELPESLGLITMPTGDSDAVEIGDPVAAIGFPGIGGDSVTLTKGTIAGFLDEDIDGQADWFKTDAEVNHGNSGGAAVNDAGELIGVPTAGVTDVGGAGKLGLVRPLSWAVPLIRVATSEITATFQISIAGARISSIVFTDSIDRRGRPGSAAAGFSHGVRAVYASFAYEGFEDGLIFRAAWTRDGEPAGAESWVWTGGVSGNDWVSVGGDPDLTDGAYELTVSLDGHPVGGGVMTVGASQAAEAPAFTGLVFAENVSEGREPIGAHGASDAFPKGTAQVLAFFDYRNMTDGTPWSYQWRLDGEELARGDGAWSGGSSGTSWVTLFADGGLPGGSYELELWIGTASAVGGSFKVEGGRGLGRSTDRGVVVLGTVLDADTGRPVPGATIIALNSGVSASAFMRKPDQRSVHASGEADALGRFRLSRPLDRGIPYALVVAADGYQMAVDAQYTIPASAGSPQELSIELQSRD